MLDDIVLSIRFFTPIYAKPIVSLLFYILISGYLSIVRETLCAHKGDLVGLLLMGLCSVVFTAVYTLYSVQCSMYSTHCTLYTEYSVQCYMYSTHCTLYTEYSVECALIVSACWEESHYSLLPTVM